LIAANLKIENLHDQLNNLEFNITADRQSKKYTELSELQRERHERELKDLRERHDEEQRRMKEKYEREIAQLRESFKEKQRHADTINAEQEEQILELKKSLNETLLESRSYTSSTEVAEGSLQVYRAEMRKTLEKLKKTHQSNKDLRQELYKSSEVVSQALALRKSEQDQRKHIEQLRQENDRLTQLLIENDQAARKLKRDFDKLYNKSHSDMVDMQSRLEEEKQEMYQQKDLDIEKVKTALVRQNEEHLKMLSNQQYSEQQALKSTLEQEKTIAIQQLRKQLQAEREKSDLKDREISDLLERLKECESQVAKSTSIQLKLEKLNNSIKARLDESLREAEELAKKARSNQALEEKSKNQHTKIVHLKKLYGKLKDDCQKLLAKRENQHKEEIRILKETLHLKEQQLQSLETIRYAIPKPSPGDGPRTPKRYEPDAAVIDTGSSRASRSRRLVEDELLASAIGSAKRFSPSSTSLSDLSIDLSLGSHVSGLSSLDNTFDSENKITS
jgi:hypothetical protein